MTEDGRRKADKQEISNNEQGISNTEQRISNYEGSWRTGDGFSIQDAGCS